jgi:peptide deformylase
VVEQPIVIYGDPVLREVSKPINEIDGEIKKLVSNMKDTLKEANGLGLAAVQIGELKRVFIVDISALDIDASLKVFINPEILEKSGEIEFEEGCLSIPGIYQKVTRSEKVRVKATGIDGKDFEMEIDGMTARVILHEYDHLEGKLFLDYISPMAKTLLKGRLKKLSSGEASTA